MRWVSGSATVSLRRCGVPACDSRAAALLLVVMVLLRLAFPRGRALIGSLLYGLFNFAGSFGLTSYGLVQVHDGRFFGLASLSCRRSGSARVSKQA